MGFSNLTKKTFFTGTYGKTFNLFHYVSFFNLLKCFWTELQADEIVKPMQWTVAHYKKNYKSRLVYLKHEDALP